MGRWTLWRAGGTPSAWERARTSLLEIVMLSWAITFLVIAIIAAVFGFGGIAAGAVGIAKVLFFLFLIAFVVSMFMHVRGSRGPRI
jgi:uncharacterized membrane protein YtjA (UPF0391 family)